ncbi:MAG: DoxX family protein [Marinirhabdus sp.]|nr:DoxX family protein [Marinirhabdus sp.]
MNIADTIERYHKRTRDNLWMHYFTIFTRVALAAGFIPSGMVKILGERFTALSSQHPLGQYFDALDHTGYYYTFIGVMQVTAAILLLIPRTALLGALIYFPIILNIVILTFSVRFDGSLFTSPLMLMANVYILFWNYDKLKHLLSTRQLDFRFASVFPKAPNKKFPIYSFITVLAITVGTVFGTTNMYDIMPKNTMPECKKQFDEDANPQAVQAFCDCIHTEGKRLNDCMKQYWKLAEN